MVRLDKFLSDAGVGTRTELKAMIRTGEKITVEVFSLPKEALDGLRQLPGVVDVDYGEGRLVIHCTSGEHNLITVLDYLKGRQIPFGYVYAEPPTLNDVFLAITGRQLRD